MACRPFAGIQTVTGSAQPCFGTSLSAAATPPVDQFSGNLNPGSNETQVTLNVAATVGFRQGDTVAVGPTAAFHFGTVAVASVPDTGTVKSITDATHMIVQGLKKSHAVNEWVVLNVPAIDIWIQTVTLAGTDVIYVGNSSTVASNDASVLQVLPQVNPFNPPSAGTSQPYQTAEFWVIGTASDTFLARFDQI